MLATVAAGAAASFATIEAYRYSARTGEDFVYVYAFLAWVGVAMLAMVGGGVSWWVLRRERRR